MKRRLKLAGLVTALCLRLVFLAVGYAVGFLLEPIVRGFGEGIASSERMSDTMRRKAEELSGP